jgi:glycosyltransferase involved in cell wall biosynthesis
MTRPTVLVVSESFTPGFRGGGTRHAIATVRALRDEVDFRVLTRDRDVGDARAFQVKTDRWLDLEIPGARVRYVSPRHLGLRRLTRSLREISPDVVLTNSVFSRLAMRVLLLRRLGLLHAPAIVAPEGEFYPGALALKAGRKRLFRMVVRAAGLFRQVTWRATSEEEAHQIRGWAGARARIVMAPVVTPRLTGSPPVPAPAKRAGELRLLYLSRITPKKNLRFLLDVLAELDGTVSLDIVGPIGDEAYWRDCRRAMARLPANVIASYHGEARPEETGRWFVGSHALALPTFGENFGLVIHEALAAARPALIGTDTPWTGLAGRKAGYNLAPDDRIAWKTALSQLVWMDVETWTAWSVGARQFARQFEQDDDAAQRLLALLRNPMA